MCKATRRKKDVSRIPREIPTHLPTPRRVQGNFLAEEGTFRLSNEVFVGNTLHLCSTETQLLDSGKVTQSVHDLKGTCETVARHQEATAGQQRW